MDKADSLEKAVIGPHGERLTAKQLPPIGTSRWVARRKAEVVTAIDGGLLSVTSACARYNLSLEELATWQRDYGKDGLKGLKRAALEEEIRAHRLERQQRHILSPSVVEDEK